MANEGQVNLTDETVEVRTHKEFDANKKANVFKPEANKTYRIRFTSDNVVLRKRHYNPTTRRYFRCLQHEGYCPVCVAAQNKVGKIKYPSDTFGANILVYDTQPDGSLIEPLNAEVYFWAFGSDKFSQLRSIIKEWGPITELDLTLTCTDAQFQKVTMNTARKCMYLESEQFKAACDQKIQDDSYPLEKFLCKELPIVDLCKEFGLDESYIPENIRQQMQQGQTATQQAVEQSVQQTQPAQQQAQAVPEQTIQQSVQQTQPVQQPPTENFSSLDELASLL